MKTKIYLARHGQTLWNKTRRLQGQLNSELTPLGKVQSLEIADKLIIKNIALIISSPLGRAQESAFICQQKLNVVHYISENLMERNFGCWQGKEVKNLQVLPEYDEMLSQVTALEINGAESALACGYRIINAIKQLANEHAGQNILIIFHGEALRCLLFILGKKETENAFDLYNNGCIVTLDFQPKAPYLTISYK
jgi:broad specificity phosphatase PhoE